jgi:phospholipase C
MFHILPSKILTDMLGMAGTEAATDRPRAKGGIMKRILKALVVSVPVLAAAVAATSASSASQAVPATPVRHVVVLYLENHSFDNVLGYWCKSHPHRCPDGGMPASISLSNGTVVVPGVTPDMVPYVGHTVQAQRKAINGGRMNGWQNVYDCQASTGYACISGYKPHHIPNEIALAQRFAISDHTFSMADSPSWGGHLYAATSSLDGFWGNNPTRDTAPGAPGPRLGWGCDSNKVTVWTDPQGKNHRSVPSCIPDPALGLPNGGAFKPTPVRYIPTIFDRLGAARLPWKIYGTPKPARFNLQNRYRWSICPSLAECLYTSQDRNLVPSSQFVHDAHAGVLPAYSAVVPGSGTSSYSQHNNYSMAAGDNWIGQVASAVMNGPEWRSTALFITYDDCGCFYDQVRPGVNPDGTSQGPRVPLVIVSPYARPGYTDTTATTFAGILAFIEHTFGLAPLNANDRHAYDFSNAFNFAQAPLRPVPMVARPLPHWATHIRLSPAMLNDPS